MAHICFDHDREYPLRPVLMLSEPGSSDSPLADLLRARRSRRHFGGEAISLPDVSFLLDCGNGETSREMIDPGGGQPPVAISLRSIPSGGALHPTRIFAVVLKNGDLTAGVYHFDVPRRLLEIVKHLAEPDIRRLFEAFPIHPQVVDLEGAAAMFFITSKFWRSRAKYGPRGYRYCLHEAGAACQNLALAATALELPHVVLGGFYDDEVHTFLGIDGVDHAVITSVAVGTPTPGPERRPSNAEC
jgi:SagB-type dehydrogenase family enzyme